MSGISSMSNTIHVNDKKLAGSKHKRPVQIFKIYFSNSKFSKDAIFGIFILCKTDIARDALNEMFRLGVIF
jgi:hypothetical protein